MFFIRMLPPMLRKTNNRQKVSDRRKQESGIFEPKKLIEKNEIPN